MSPQTIRSYARNGGKSYACADSGNLPGKRKCAGRRKYAGKRKCAGKKRCKDAEGGKERMVERVQEMRKERITCVSKKESEEERRPSCD